MDGMCIMNEEYEKSFKFWSENLNGKDNKTDTSVYERLIKKVKLSL
jgi:hypothetical protein